MNQRKKRPRQSLTQRTRNMAVIGQAMALIVGALGILGGAALAADEQAAGIAIALGAAAWASTAYGVLLYIEWQVARAILERRHAVAMARPEVPTARGARAV